MQSHPEHNPDDADLWKSFRTGDDEAFGQIARHYYKSLFSYGSKFSRDREFVKDCIQETLNQQINQLTRRPQEIIYPRFFESMDNEAIAQVMGISRPAVGRTILPRSFWLSLSYEF
ncbi:hypothetical protein SAMN05216327_102638 [Dyadobacter sp. SG02]|uniref:RNA polymerase sigma factor n=1 Tax=Dyadobacter sp. SG02 TaxID=1855291 RepID=UPI0008AF8D2E|nr:sigma factor-like helix-turn-helix DNA-binding protein [Dyadobacter sp. SG02]SEI59289.1 hypothetical protein SAMN05216327_102638 [Dyadobacter sp. SG02]